MSEPELNVDIPNEAGWPIQSVDSLCSLISRGTAPVYVEHSEVLAIGQRCVASTGFAPDFARPHSHHAMRNVLRPESGDVLLNSTGTGTIGRSVVFNSPGTFIVDGHVTVMRPRVALADSRWLNSVLRTPAFQRHLERFCFCWLNQPTGIEPHTVACESIANTAYRRPAGNGAGYRYPRHRHPRNRGDHR